MDRYDPNDNTYLVQPDWAEAKNRWVKPAMLVPGWSPPEFSVGDEIPVPPMLADVAIGQLGATKVLLRQGPDSDGNCQVRMLDGSRAGQVTDVPYVSLIAAHLSVSSLPPEPPSQVDVFAMLGQLPS